MTNHPAPDAHPSQTHALTRSSPFDSIFLTTSALHGAITTASSLLAGAALLGALGVLMNAGMTGGSSPIASGVESSEVLWQAFLVLTALPFSGQLHAGFETVGGFFNTGDLGFTLGVWPLVSLAFVAISSCVSAHFLERRTPLRTRTRRAGASAAAAGAFASLMVVVAAPGMRVDSMGSVFTVSALTPSLAFVAFTVVFASGYLGRARALGTQAPIGRPAEPASSPAQGLAGFFAEFTIYAGSLAVAGSLLGVIALVAIFVQAGSQGATLPALLAAAPHLALAALVLGHLGVVTINVPYAVSETVSVFSPGLPFAWLALPIIVLSSLGASLIIGVGRAPTRVPRWSSAWRLPALALLLWSLTAAVLLPITVHGSASIFGLSAGDVGFGARPAFWTPALFALWAIAVEIGAWILPRHGAELAPRVHASALRVRRWISAVIEVGSLTRGATAAGAGRRTQVPEGPPVPHVPPQQSAADPTTTMGHAVSTATPYPPQAAEVRRLSPRARKRLRVAGITTVIAVLVVTGAGIAVTTANTQRGAVAQAREYVDAIAAGHASRANELVDPNMETSLRDYVSDDMLASATERITVLDVTATELSPATSESSWLSAPVEQAATTGRDTQNVQVSYRLGGITETVVLTAERVDNELLVLEKWRITTPLVFESAAGTSHAIDMTIGSVRVTPGRVESSTWEGSQPVSWVPFTAYPGIYPVSGAESDFYSVASEPVRVGQPVEQFVPDRNVVYTPTDALETAVEAAVTQKIDDCAAATTAATDGCPFGTYVSTSNTTVTWSVASYPTVTISTTSNSFELENGMANYTYSGRGGRAVTGSDAIRGTGSYTVEGDAVTVEFH